MKLSNETETNNLLLNNMPVEDFLGLSPNEIHNLIYDSYGDNSPVQFRDDIDDKTLDQIPLFRIVEDYLKILQRDKQIKLTPLGALPKKVIVELYDKRFVLDYFIESRITKLWREENWIALRSARLSAQLAGLVKKSAGKLSLPKKAINLVDSNNRVQIFKLFYQAYTDKFLWSFNDNYPEHPVGKLGWAFSVMMLDKFGDQPQVGNFYAEKYLKAFPMFLNLFENDYSMPKRHLFNCYRVRTFDRFFVWFGLVNIDHPKRYSEIDTNKIERTDLVKSVFKIDY